MAKLVECVPNFSVSREKNPAVFQGLVDTANSIPGCFVFDVQSDGNHNRCVFTLLGSPEAMGEADGDSDSDADSDKDSESDGNGDDSRFTV